jgi:hypothetical protein
MSSKILQKLTKYEVRHSDLYGFIRRLQHLGFRLDGQWQKTYRLPNSPYKYLRSYWRLINSTDKVLFKISPHSYTLIIWHNGREQLRQTAPTSNWLEPAFLRYFNQTKPLKLRRLGKQPRKIRAWFAKYPEQHPQAGLIRRLRQPGGPIRLPSKSIARKSPMK